MNLRRIPRRDLLGSLLSLTPAQHHFTVPSEVRGRAGAVRESPCDGGSKGRFGGAVARTGHNHKVEMFVGLSQAVPKLHGGRRADVPLELTGDQPQLAV